MFRHAVITEVSKFIHIIKTEVTGWESNITLLEKPDVWRVPGSDEHPLAYIKLTVEDNHRVLNIFLNDILASIIIIITPANLFDFLQIPSESDSTSARANTGLDYPNITFSI